MSTLLVNASPTKRFFVKSLTRDIALKDAILDLLDNCIDGVLRTVGRDRLNSPDIYDGFWAEITLNEEEFSIFDNCGGIPRDVALNSAFRFGRNDDDRDAELETVGMYGIGMKRAMFKMGAHIFVECQTTEHKFTVEIPPHWLSEDNDTKDWQLELIDQERNDVQPNGTGVIVRELHPEISSRFNLKKDFISDLSTEISHIFALILRKGFKVKVNGKEIKPVSLDLLTTEDVEDNSSVIDTYQYKSIYNDVKIDIAIGFYRALASVDEIEEENELNRSRSNAGITVIANDRVVLFRDKTRATGWGSKPVPAFHNQFISIAGTVIFSSKTSENLPLTTTKRGLDLSSETYWYTLDYIKEGIKKFTDFTNSWKGSEKETARFFKRASYKDSVEIINTSDNEKWKAIPRAKHSDKRITPSLPKPPKRNTRARITFHKEKAEVELLGEAFFGDINAGPSDVGSKAFDIALKNLQV